MPNYAFTYKGEPRFERPEQGREHMEKWQAWMASLGDALISPGNPFGASKTVSLTGISDDTAADRLTGFSIVRAENMSAAVAMAQRCPHLAFGTMGVHETMDMGME